jgi:hypothetical protein
MTGATRYELLLGREESKWATIVESHPSETKGGVPGNIKKGIESGGMF